MIHLWFIEQLRDPEIAEATGIGNAHAIASLQLDHRAASIAAREIAGEGAEDRWKPDGRRVGKRRLQEGAHADRSFRVGKVFGERHALSKRPGVERARITSETTTRFGRWVATARKLWGVAIPNYPYEIIRYFV